MKRMMILLSIVGLLFAAGAEIADAQIVRSQDVLSYGSATGDFWGLSRSPRCQKALLYGWHNPGQPPPSCVALVTTLPNQGGFLNHQGGGLIIGGGNVFQGGYGNNWGYIAGTAAQAGFGYLGERSRQ